jgi:cyanophycinase
LALWFSISLLWPSMTDFVCRGAKALIPVLVAVAAHASGQPQTKPYQYFRVGNPADVKSKFEAGFALIGGGKDLDPAFQWMCHRSGGGDFLILRATGSDAYNSYVQSICHQNSVATLVIPDTRAASDPFVAQTISNAEAIFISGGDQANYINFWKGTAVEGALNAAIHRGVPIGGTSAGLAVQGEFIYSAQNDPPDGPDLSSKMALADPFARRVVIAHDFLDDPALADTITDTHFVTRDRMGRLLVFMARILASGSVKQVRGIGIDEQTAVLLEPDGHTSVVGKGAAYFLCALAAHSQLQAGAPLSMNSIAVQKVLPGGRFDVRPWRGSATHYTFDVVAGVIHSTQANHSIY